MKNNIITSCWVCLLLGISAFEQDPKMGRIEEFDAILMRYTRNIAKGVDLESVILEFEQIDAEIPSEIRMKEYYYEVCRGISEKGDTHILSERNRLNSIMSGASDDEDGVRDTVYAYKRRNILEAFVDAAAQYVMQEFNMDSSEAIRLNTEDLGEEFVQTLEMNNVNFETKGPKTIKLDPSNFKIKKVKKNAQHDEM